MLEGLMFLEAVATSNLPFFKEEHPVHNYASNSS